MPESDVLERCDRVRAHDARESADPLGDYRVSLVWHRGAPLLSRGEILLRLEHLRALQVTDLCGELFERGGNNRESRHELGVPIALHDLRRDGIGLQAETLADILL